MTKLSSGTDIDISICSINNIVDKPQEYVNKTSHGRLKSFAMARLGNPLGRFLNNKGNRIEYARLVS